MANKSKVIEKASTQLDAPGDGDGVVRMGKIQPAGSEVEVTVAAIDTSISFKLEYSDDGFSTSVDGPTETITANGTFVYPGAVGYEEVQPVFTAEVGGTAATVDFTIRLSY